ncbi:MULTISPECIES: mycothione reductase [Brachybacterium]|uniref:Mycothione reductase n=2 Tax=Brachybacterium TaxID=43668 RepID=A0A426SPQ0_9MICO|nr:MULTISPECIES: mycothione reductase [Brachybacterium]MCT1437991.1 mycothione reductase [Brachybacterium paraconglomeratum]RRR20262.1 mycothione reductase [Brachybacterium paraconglomeratum]GLI32134.1 mycothione reductase [Brachybacterium conglomeratum]GLK03668.1 mycothione reductase [Brachybacterium conglomeratum]HJF48539.1 mycothione reductase [Brachybacterium paraconglomeratum]
MTETTHYDIALIGSGSANSFPGPDLADRTIVQIDRGVGPDRVFGGTCLNLGCIPTKMFVHTADLAATPADAARFGLTEQLQHVDWPAIRDRIFGRIDPITAGGEAYRRDHEDNANLTLLRGTARFVGEKELLVDGDDGSRQRITADTIVLGAGSRPVLPPIDGLADLAPHTSDTIMRVEALPASLAILGSGVVAVEMAHVLSALGVEVTLIARSQRVLRAADADISARLTELLGERLHLVTGFDTTSARRTADGVELRGTREGREETLRAEELLVAVGRRPNSDLLDVRAAGIDVAEDGRVEVDAYQRVLAGGEVREGVFAFGDLSSPHQLKHVANHEQRIVRHNVLHPEQLRRSDTMPVPSGVFTHPHVAWVGMDEETARASGREVRVAVQEYASIAYGWALEDTTGFAKIIADAETTEILGAHLIGPEATTLIQLLIQAMSTGQTARDIATTQYWIHPAMPELIENALLQLVD